MVPSIGKEVGMPSFVAEFRVSSYLTKLRVPSLAKEGMPPLRKWLECDASGGGATLVEGVSGPILQGCERGGSVSATSGGGGGPSHFYPSATGYALGSYVEATLALCQGYAGDEGDDGERWQSDQLNGRSIDKRTGAADGRQCV